MLDGTCYSSWTKGIAKVHAKSFLGRGGPERWSESELGPPQQWSSGASVRLSTGRGNR